PLTSITAIYVGDGTVYNPSIRYLKTPSPLPPGCDTNFLASVQSYLPLLTNVSIILGVSTQATGLVYKNKFGLLVLSDEHGNTPVFLAPGKIATIVTNSPPGTQSSPFLSAFSGEKTGVSVKNLKIRR
ncbi:MAG: hypothetical protein WCP73_08780, partial [Eubacteriales bacterium]